MDRGPGPGHRWYLSAQAIRQYLLIAGLPDDDGGDNWGRAEQELARHSWVAKFHQPSQNGKWKIYRTGGVRVGRRRRTVRLEFTIAPPEPDKGPLDVLYFIRKR